MNAIGPIIRQTDLLRDYLDKAEHAVNTWRGKWIHAFTQAETAVTETLVYLSELPKNGPTIELPHLLGQRLDALARATGPEGAYAREGKAVAVTLSAFRKHEALRTAVCHGVASVTINRQGKWIVVFKVVALRSGKAVITKIALDECDAAQALLDLQKVGQRLCSQLGNLRASATTAAKAPAITP